MLTGESLPPQSTLKGNRVLSVKVKKGSDPGRKSWLLHSVLSLGKLPKFSVL